MKIPKLMDINYQYIPSAKTDVLATLKRLGFQPPSEDIRYQEKWVRFRNANAINNGGKVK